MCKLLERASYKGPLLSNGGFFSSCTWAVLPMVCLASWWMTVTVCSTGPHSCPRGLFLAAWIPVFRRAYSTNVQVQSLPLSVSPETAQPSVGQDLRWCDITIPVTHFPSAGFLTSSQWGPWFFVSFADPANKERALAGCQWSCFLFGFFSLMK